MSQIVTDVFFNWFLAVPMIAYSMIHSSMTGHSSLNFLASITLWMSSVVLILELDTKYAHQ